MSIDDIFFDRLKDVAGSLQPIVGTKIYPVEAPQNTALPYCVWTYIDKTRTSAMGVDTAIVRARIQIDGFHTTFALARALEEAIRSRVQRWRSAGPPVVQDTFLLDTSGPVRDEAASGVTAIYRVTAQIELIYEESVGAVGAGGFGSPIGLLLLLTKASAVGAGGIGSPLGLLLLLTKAS